MKDKLSSKEKNELMMRIRYFKYTQIQLTVYIVFTYPHEKQIYLHFAMDNDYELASSLRIPIFLFTHILLL